MRALRAFVFVLAVPSVALANGRYPLSQQVLVDPSEPLHLYLRSTYGVLTTPDAGKTWSWLCEPGIGYDPGEDPMMAILGDGTAFAGASEGLFTTHDRGCSWPKDTMLGDRYVRDLAVEPDHVAMVAATLAVSRDGRYDAHVFRTPDGAATWTDLGSVAEGSVLPFTLDVAPSDRKRLYVSAVEVPSGADAGASDGTGKLFVSRDGGTTFASTLIPGTDRQNPPFIAAVDPSNPDALYVRVQGAWDGTNPVRSWLLYSSDAGATWKEAFRASADMLGFALTPDGNGVLVGMGDTRDVQRPVDTSVIGLYRAATGDLSFSRVSSGQIGCLTYAGTSLYVCGGQATDGYELGVSNDDGATVTPVFEYGTVEGPLECPASSPQAMLCASQWPLACRGLGSCPHPDAGTTPTPSGGGSSGCCGSASPPARPQTGTAELDMFSGAGSAYAVASAVVAGLLRRLARRRGSRSRGSRDSAV